MTTMKFNPQDIAENSHPRLPVCLVLDTSGSMEGEPINELNKGVRSFMQELLEDEIARYVTDVAIITFGGTVEIITDFSNIENCTFDKFSASGRTPLGAAINKALDLIDGRTQSYKYNGAEFYDPWICLMSDGKPTDNITTAATRIQSLVQADELKIFPVAIGDGANLNTLNSISPKIKPLKLQGLEFKKFFTWFSQSVIKITQSIPGDKVSLSKPTWAEVTI